MIKVMIERQVKARQDLTFLILELRISAAMYPEVYIDGHILVSKEDSSKVVTISTWRSIDDWERWANSEARAKLYRETAAFLRGKPKVSIFEEWETKPTVED